MIPESEERRPLIEAPKFRRLASAGRGGRPIAYETVFRWQDQGVKVRGRIIKLDVERTAGRIKTSEEAVNRFLDLVAQVRAGAPPAPAKAPESGSDRAEQAMVQVTEQLAPRRRKRAAA